jgi:precorrin-4/cobalt-precorrin-4 C11-methyltransferase
VGAGPGDPELLTLKGARLLASADVVLYAGSLVNEKILDVCRDGCEKINSVDMDLDEQVSLMTSAIRIGRSVVRLHTGDPCLYGAISEQTERLAKNGVECEIVPGVSSFQGAAARFGIEYTIPGRTQTLICTRAAGRTQIPENEDLARLASHGASLVVFLSAGMAGTVAKKCEEAGMPGDTPAAWIYRATWEDERSCLTTLKDLPVSMEEAGISNHALIIIGECLKRDPASRSLLYTRGFEGGQA